MGSTKGRRKKDDDPRSLHAERLHLQPLPSGGLLRAHRRTELGSARQRLLLRPELQLRKRVLVPSQLRLQPLREDRDDLLRPQRTERALPPGLPFRSARSSPSRYALDRPPSENPVTPLERERDDSVVPVPGSTLPSELPEPACVAGDRSKTRGRGTADDGSAGDDGSPAVASALVENHRRFLAFLGRRVARPEDAEEILQEAYVRSITRGDTVREGEASTAWFYRLLRNALVDYYRRQGAEQRALDAMGQELAAHDATISPALDAELRNVVCGCVSALLPTLSPSYAEALRRVDLDGERVQDYATALGISANNAAVRLYRARQALREKLLRSCGTCAKHGCVDCQCGASSDGAPSHRAGPSAVDGPTPDRGSASGCC